MKKPIVQTCNQGVFIEIDAVLLSHKTTYAVPSCLDNQNLYIRKERGDISLLWIISNENPLWDSRE